jgi:hypothetical protein
MQEQLAVFISKLLHDNIPAGAQPGSQTLKRSQNGLAANLDEL